MTDDLTRGYEEQDGSVTESAEATQSETSAEGTATLAGQAGETVVVNRPAPGQTIEIQAAPGQTYVLNFAPGAAQVQVDGDNFILAFDDNGDGTPDSQVVFLDLATVADSGGEAPTFQVAGVDIPSETLVAQALELAGQGETLDDVAAGPGATGGGGSTYSDDFGELNELLEALGVIDPTELQFRLIDLENEIVFPALEEGENPLLINEIGVNVALRIPKLPGGPPPIDGGGDYAQTFGVREGYGKEAVEKYNFIELINNSSGAFDASGNVIEILNPAGVIVSFTIPDGTVVPPGGTVVFYQSTNDNDTAGVEEIYVRIFDAAGNVVGGQDLPAETFWALGLDTTEAIAVNLVDGGESVDAFAANITQAQLGGLTGSPAFAGAPDDFLSPLLDLNLETFNGQFTGNHHIFSRVNLTDTDSANDWTTNNTPTDGLLNDTTLVDGGEGGPDLNPWDPLNDDLNPMQVNADPLAGQNFLEVADDTGGIVEGYGGPDFIQGLGGSDSLYGGSEEMYLEQSGKVLGQFFELLFGGFKDGADDLTHTPYFSDHNDFLFGEAGDDHMYGGSGGDFMIGGEGDDSMDGGTGDDQIYGDGHETIGGLPVEGEGSGDEGAIDYGDDVIAGDALNNISGLLFSLFGDDTGDGGDDTGAGGEGISSTAFAETDVGLSFLDEIEEGDIGAAIAIMGGNDTIFAGKGDDKVSGDALATGTHAALAFSYADDSVKRPEDGLNRHDAGFGNDVIKGDEGNDSIAGDAGAIVDGGEGGFALAVAKNIATHGKSGAEVGSDFIKGGAGDDVIAGEALAVAEDGVAAAVSVNKAEGSWHPYKGKQGGDAGNDTIFGDGGEGHSGHDSIGGDAAALGEFAIAKAFNHAEDKYSDAGNDKIVADNFPWGSGDDVIAGDALAVSNGAWGLSKAHNTAKKDAQAGDDTIHAGHGDNIFSGDALTIEDGELRREIPKEILTDDNSAYAFNTALWGGSAGNDFITAGWGDDLGAGDAAEISQNNAHAHVENSAVGWGSQAGNDTILTDGGDDTVSGGSLAKGKDDALAKTENDAYWGASAGNDKIIADTFPSSDGNDEVAGDAMALAKHGDAKAIANNTADGYGSDAGNDTLWAGSGDNVVAGDAMAQSKFGDATAYANNTAKNGAEAGNDEILTGWGEDIVSGGSQAIAFWGDAKADTDNKATGHHSSAGNDYIDVDGGWWNKVAGDSQAIGKVAKASGENDAKHGDGNVAGDDTIKAGWGSDTISGDSQAIGGHFAAAKQDNHAGDHWHDDWNRAGNDDIHAGDGDNAVAGDAQAIALYGAAKAYSHNHADGGWGNTAGDDEVFTGKGDDSISGDAQALGEYYAEAKSENKAEGKYDTGAGNDFIKAGDGDNRVAGDAMAVAAYGTAKAYGNNSAWKDSKNDAGNDTIKTGDDEDTVSGGALAIAKYHALADQDNWADDGAQAGDDQIYADYELNWRKHDDDTVSGDALAISKGGNWESAVADANNYADDWARAGNDKIDAGYGDNVIAGDALAINTGWGEAWATVHNTATDGGWAGNDTIYAGDGQHIIGGDAAALAHANPFVGGYRAYTHNKASGAFSGAGNDVINVGDGSYPYAALSIWVPGRNGQDQIPLTVGVATASLGTLLKFYGSIIAGESVTTGNFAHAHATNEVAPDYVYTGAPVLAGNDSITAGNGGNVIAGDALAVGRYANASVYNTANDPNAYALVGNDTIVTGYGKDLISGDAMATDGGSALVDNDLVGQELAWIGQDSILAGGGNDTVAGDALSVNGLAAVNYGGDDYIDGGSGNDLIAGDALALGTGYTDVGEGGDDIIYGGSGHDTIFGETNDFSDGTTGGNDFIDGGAGEWDRIYGQSGNDTIVFDGHDDDGAGWVDGGDGYDTLLVDMTANNDGADGFAGGLINFTALENDWHNFEAIDMRDAPSGDAGSDAIRLNLSDVVDMTDVDNDLDILGDSDDSVQLAGGGWVNSGSAGGFTTYTNTFDATVSVRIEDDVTVSFVP